MSLVEFITQYSFESSKERLLRFLQDCLEHQISEKHFLLAFFDPTYFIPITGTFIITLDNLDYKVNLSTFEYPWCFIEII